MQDTFQHPNVPGWEVFRNALNIFLSDKPERDATIQVSTSLEARKNEFIPDDHRQEICDLVLQAGILSADNEKGYEIADPVIHFIHHQVGRDKLTEMLAVDGKWEIEECDCPNGIGYHVYTTDRQRFREGVRRERSHRLAERLFGGLGGVMALDMEDLMRGTGRDREEGKPSAEEAAATVN